MKRLQDLKSQAGKDLVGLANPAWDLLQTVPEDDMWKYHSNGRFQPAPFSTASQKLVPYRDMFTRRITWAIPEPGALDLVADIARDKGIVEIGAGTGYWAWMLAQRGIDVNAYDPYPVIEGENPYFKDDNYARRLGLDAPLEFFDVIQGGSEVLAKPENADRVLFLCWPSYDRPWAYEAVQEYQGSTIVYIGEGPGGCTGEGSLHKLLMGSCGCWDDDCPHEHIIQAWQEVESYPIPQWGGLHDDLYVFERMPIKELA